jgi:hypothetical protein
VRDAAGPRGGLKERRHAADASVARERRRAVPGGIAIQSASLIGRSGSSAFRLSTITASMSLRGLVLLFGISTTALPSWVSRTRWNNLKNGLAVRRYGRSKQTDELISSIVPRGTSFHRSVELEVSPIVPGQPSCHCELSSPTELGAVNPYAVHDHGQPTRQRHDRLLHPAVLGDLHRPGLEP